MVENAVVCWHTEFMGLAVGELRGAGREVDARGARTHLSGPQLVVNYYGSITVDYERELAQSNDQGYRPKKTTARKRSA